MAEEHFVCQGAVCMCKFGAAPDKLRVLTQDKVYVNDPGGSQKLMASTMELGPTFEKNTFGSCKKLPFSPPCAASVTGWKGFYDKVELPNGGNPLLEGSKATCPIGGPGCIEITFHGQTAEMSTRNEENAGDGVAAQLFPFGELGHARENKALIMKS